MKLFPRFYLYCSAIKPLLTLVYLTETCEKYNIIFYFSKKKLKGKWTFFAFSKKNSWKRLLYCGNSGAISFFLSFLLFLVVANTVDFFGHWSMTRYFLTAQKSVECFGHHVRFFLNSAEISTPQILKQGRTTLTLVGL